MDIVSYVLGKKYTDDTASQFGGLKGANCQIKSTEKVDDETIVTFLWKNDNDETQESQIVLKDGAPGKDGADGQDGAPGKDGKDGVDGAPGKDGADGTPGKDGADGAPGKDGKDGKDGADGTPIYPWQSGHEYNIGDLAIYDNCFYLCIVANEDIVFDDTKWNGLGSSDGNYDIVATVNDLPNIFAITDRKVYYVIAVNNFYLWNGTTWVPFITKAENVILNYGEASQISLTDKIDDIEDSIQDIVDHPYELPAASNSTLGGVKVGNNLSIDANGVLSATGGSSVSNIEDLDNVNISSLIDKQILRYNSTSQRWENDKTMVILSYGKSTWADVLAAYNANSAIYCRASSGSDPSEGSQTRLAFLAYVNNETSPTEMEFQYYRSVNAHSVNQQGDQVYIYKIVNDGTWSVTTRNAFSKIVAGNNMTSSYSNNTLTLNAVGGDTSNCMKKGVDYVTAGQKIGTTLGMQATAEGYDTSAYGDYSHAEGYLTKANEYAHAEGDFTYANEASHSEGRKTSAIGTTSHSEGYYTCAYGNSSHAEGESSIAMNGVAHAEGYATTADEYAHAEGYQTYAYQFCHAEGYCSTAFGDSAHVEGYGTYTADVRGPHSEGCITSAIGIASHSEGYKTYAYGNGSHAEGGYNQWSSDERGTFAVGDSSHAEGYFTCATGQCAHAEGWRTCSNGDSTHTEGDRTFAAGWGAHAEGYETSAYGDYSHAEGRYTYAAGYSAHTEGASTTATESCSHAEGNGTITTGDSSHAEGYCTCADNDASHAQGHYNAAMTTGGNLSDKLGTAFVIGNGTSSSTLSNAFSVQFDGTVKAANTITASTTADYAEMFEWIDENPYKMDRVGYFVTTSPDDCTKITIANANDEYILGIVSGNPFVLGNGDCDVWNGMMLRDEFGRVIYEKPGVPKYNPNYDPSQPYVSRLDRPEWAAVGMLGVLAVRDDGTCQVGGYCAVANGGIATKAAKYNKAANCYKVIERINNNIIKVIFR